MIIPSKKKALFRKYEGVLLYSRDYSKKDQIYGFYLLLRPMLGWVKRDLMSLGLEAEEAESELFLLAHKVFSKFDGERSSIIPYLESQLNWWIVKLLKSVQKKQKPIDKLDVYEPYESYELDEEFYWRVPGILFEEQYVGKCFTKAEKYLIYVILTVDEDKLSTTGLATTCKMQRHRMRMMLSDMREQLLEEF